MNLDIQYVRTVDRDENCSSNLFFSLLFCLRCYLILILNNTVKFVVLERINEKISYGYRTDKLFV